jgi:hypothetical protein
LLHKFKILVDCSAQSIKTLNHQVFFRILSSKSEDTDDYRPTRLNIIGLCSADFGYTHDNIFLDLRPGMQVVHHDSFKWLQEVLLEVETHKFSLE